MNIIKNNDIDQYDLNELEDDLERYCRNEVRDECDCDDGTDGSDGTDWSDMSEEEWDCLVTHKWSYLDFQDCIDTL